MKLEPNDPWYMEQPDSITWEDALRRTLSLGREESAARMEPAFDHLCAEYVRVLGGVQAGGPPGPELDGLKFEATTIRSHISRTGGPNPTLLLVEFGDDGKIERFWEVRG